MSELTPITRVESYLDAIVNNGIPPTEDITRIETFLQAIYDNQVCALTPITRIEMFLGKISGQNIVLPEPITRIELYLAAIAGEDVELPENPITRLEMYLADWADSGDWTTISGAIVEFITQRAHKLKSCVVSLSPQQDLHGYDSPWPAGGGKNKFYRSTNQSNTLHGMTCSFDASTQEFTISGTNESSSAYILLSMTPTEDLPRNVAISRAFIGAPAGIYINLAYYDSYWHSVSNGETIPDSISLSNINIQVGVLGTVGNVPETSFKCQIQEGSSAPTEWTPFSNICPISGRTGCEVFARGHNMWDEEWESGDLEGVNGTPVPSSSYIRSKNFCSCLPNTTYFCKKASSNTYIFWYDENETHISHRIIANDMEITSPSGARYFKLSIAGTTYNHDISINYPSTDTEYHAYSGNSYSVTWEDSAGTVYGGTVDLVSGVLTATHKMVQYTGAYGENWGEYASGSDNFCAVIYPSGKKIGYQKSICNEFKNVNAAFSNSAYGIYCDHPTLTNTYFRMPNPSVNTLGEFKSWLANNPIQLAYELATPITIQLTPQQITALKGYNAMWSDGGDIEVTVHGTPVELSTQQALNMLLGGAYHNNQTAEDVSDDEALDIILGGDNK